ncbi:hypothetical protein H2202_007206 [Exophiala xenobiotica]|nr:hypothetical protein H2202_007206 [Exophiala xenobiotica]KAK5203925.1 hypothetical protein LTR41_010382 [Exophiala xenobiotica]
MSTSKSLDLKEREAFKDSIHCMQNALLAQSARLEHLEKVRDARNGSKVQLEDMQNQLNLVTLERDRLEDDLAAAKDQARSARTDRFKLEVSLRQLNASMTKALRDRTSQKERLDETTTKLKDAEKSLRQYTDHSLEMERRVRELEGLPIHYQRQSNQLEQAVDNLSEYHSQHRQRYNELSDKVSGLEEEIDDLQQQLSSRLRTLTKAASENEALERKLEAAIDEKKHWKTKHAEELPSLRKAYEKENAALKQKLEQERELRKLLQEQRNSDWHDDTLKARAERRKRLREAESSEEEDVRANIPGDENSEAQQYRAIRQKSRNQAEEQPSSDPLARESQS